MSPAPGEPTPGLVSKHDLDPVEHQALHQALTRLPAGAFVAGPELLTPSIRAVLDRFLSAQLRTPLRTLGLPDGPAAIVVGHLGVDVATHERGSIDHNPAIVSWLIEAAGLFRAPSDLMQTRLRSACGYDAQPDHLLLFVRSLPPTSARTLGIASVAETIKALGLTQADLFRQPQLCQLAADEAKTTMELNIGTAVLVDRRRALVHVDRSEHRLPWLERVDLVADPWSAATPKVENERDGGS